MIDDRNRAPMAKLTEHARDAHTPGPWTREEQGGYERRLLLRATIERATKGE